MIDKSINHIDCVDVRNRQKNGNMTYDDDDTIITEYIHDVAFNISESLSELEIDVCRAEVDSQKLDSALNVYTAPFGTLL